MNWPDKALEVLGRESKLVLVTLCQVEGSAPRGAGTKMLIWAGGQFGTIGGGELEYRLTKAAHKMLSAPAEQPVLADYPLGPVLGQCCGGFVRALLEPLDPSATDWLVEWANGETAWATDVLTGEKSSRPADGSSGAITVLDQEQAVHSNLMPLEQCRFVVEQPPAPLPPVWVFGAGHIGIALHAILSRLDVDLRWIDDRKALAGQAEYCPDPVQLARTAPDDALIIILTYNHDLDYDLCRAVLSRDNVRLCALIGSKTKRARFVTRLKRDGLAQKQIARLTCPAGLPGIGGKHPDEISVAIAAQILQTIKD
ncbi:MAG: xanthine dehydrogenase accessory protein XdhC [Robiginitomaculum sp.]|nr:MAG: xanthine dehydrogenase accessory protein XdhC [Robiginitomaculum sp.]